MRADETWGSRSVIQLYFTTNWIEYFMSASGAHLQRVFTCAGGGTVQRGTSAFYHLAFHILAFSFPTWIKHLRAGGPTTEARLSQEQLNHLCYTFSKYGHFRQRSIKPTVSTSDAGLLDFYGFTDPELLIICSLLPYFWNSHQIQTRARLILILKLVLSLQAGADIFFFLSSTTQRDEQAVRHQIGQECTFKSSSDVDKITQQQIAVKWKAKCVCDRINNVSAQIFLCESEPVGTTPGQ